MKIKLRELTKNGVQEASRLLEAVRAGQEKGVPASFLSDDRYSVELSPAIAKPKAGEFTTRWQLGLWLYRELDGVVDDKNLFNRPGMWSWLAMLLFETICPADDQGARTVAEDAKYLLVKGDYRKAYRHLVAGPFYLMRTHATNPQIVRAVLNKPPSSPGDLYEQVASRKQIVTSETAMRVTNQLYWDEKKGTVKRGAAGSGAGSVRRLAAILLQYDVTYDLFAMTEERLQTLLPEEFDRFLS